MVRQTKTDKQSASPAPVSAPVENVVVDQSAKKASKKAAPVAAAPVAASPAPAPVAVAPVAAAPAADAETEGSVSTKMNVFGARLQQLGALFSSIKTEFKGLERTVARELKAAQRSSSRKNKKAVSSGNRQPSGFVKPTRISDELAQFLGKTSGTEMARTDVSKEINNYIRTNGLQDKTNGRKIIADNKLSSLLKLKKDDELTYFNLQRYMKHHFIKAEPVATA
jgi:chromatin remodeling complex protein RSC6